MPINAQSSGNTFSFNKSTQVDVSVGYYSRVLYTFVPCKPGFNGNVAGTSPWESEDFGNILQAFIDDTNYAGCSHGGITLPAGYWESGKTIRIRGTVICASESGGAQLNLRFGLFDITNNASYLIGSANNGSNHSFLDGGGGGPLPVDFELNICCNSNTPDIGNAFGYGFFVYDRNNYSSAGDNRSIEYVPVWQGPGLSTVTDIGTAQTRIFLNGFGSTVSEAYFTNLFIEELA